MKLNISSSCVVLPEVRVACENAKLTGISQLRYAPDCQQTSDLVVQALLHDKPADALIVATTSPDTPSPATAHHALAKLQWPTTTLGFDVTSSCTSFLSAAIAAQGLLSNPNIKRVSVVAAEKKHSQIRKHDERLKSLFGDGACALTFENGGQGGLELCYTKVRHDLMDNIGVKAICEGAEPTLYIREPKRMYREILREMVDAILAAWDYRLHRLNSLGLDSLKTGGLIFVHQANARLLEEVRERLPYEIGRRIPILMSDLGNTVSASLPIIRTRSLMLWACAAGISDNRHSDGEDICYLSDWNGERLQVIDQGAAARQHGWLDDLSAQELGFFKELEKPTKHACDLWVSAGGGFQTMACLSYK